MGYYMSELYRRYFRATDFSELEEEIENTRQEVRDCLDQAQQRKLMHLIDAKEQLKAEIDRQKEIFFMQHSTLQMNEKE